MPCIEQSSHKIEKVWEPCPSLYPLPPLPATPYPPSTFPSLTLPFPSAVLDSVVVVLSDVENAMYRTLFSPDRVSVGTLDYPYLCPPYPLFCPPHCLSACPCLPLPPGRLDCVVDALSISEL